MLVGILPDINEYFYYVFIEIYIINWSVNLVFFEKKAHFLSKILKIFFDNLFLKFEVKKIFVRFYITNILNK